MMKSVIIENISKFGEKIACCKTNSKIYRNLSKIESLSLEIPIVHTILRNLLEQKLILGANM